MIRIVFLSLSLIIAFQVNSQYSINAVITDPEEMHGFADNSGNTAFFFKKYYSDSYDISVFNSKGEQVYNIPGYEGRVALLGNSWDEDYFYLYFFNKVFDNVKGNYNILKLPKHKDLRHEFISLSEINSQENLVSSFCERGDFYFVSTISKPSPRLIIRRFSNDSKLSQFEFEVQKDIAKAFKDKSTYLSIPNEYSDESIQSNKKVYLINNKIVFLFDDVSHPKSLIQIVEVDTLSKQLSTRTINLALEPGIEHNSFLYHEKIFVFRATAGNAVTLILNYEDGSEIKRLHFTSNEIDAFRAGDLFSSSTNYEKKSKEDDKTRKAFSQLASGKPFISIEEQDKKLKLLIGSFYNERKTSFKFYLDPQTFESLKGYDFYSAFDRAGSRINSLLELDEISKETVYIPRSSSHGYIPGSNAHWVYGGVKSVNKDAKIGAHSIFESQFKVYLAYVKKQEDVLVIETYTKAK